METFISLFEGLGQLVGSKWRKSDKQWQRFVYWGLVALVILSVPAFCLYVLAGA